MKKKEKPEKSKIPLFCLSVRSAEKLPYNNGETPSKNLLPGTYKPKFWEKKYLKKKKNPKPNLHLHLHFWWIFFFGGMEKNYPPWF